MMFFKKLRKELRRGYFRILAHFDSRRGTMSVGNYVRFLENQDAYHIDGQGRVRLQYMETDIVKGCNLRCEHCSHLSPYRSGFVPADTLLDWFTHWSGKIVPKELSLLGGEPLLHPDLDTIITESVRIWNETDIHLVSNGLMFSRVPEKVLDAILATKIHVSISLHAVDDDRSTTINDGLKRLDAAGIPYTLRKSNTEWNVQHRWNDEQRPVPFNSDPMNAWKSCGTKFCVSLAGNKLYKCAVLACMAEGLHEGVLDDAWKIVLTYKPLEPDATPQEILKHLRTTCVKECCVCPESVELILPKQISPTLLQRKKP